MSGAEGRGVSNLNKKEEQLRDSDKPSDTIQVKADTEQSDEVGAEQWERCHCELSSCDSCVAERLAMVDNAEHSCCELYVQEKLRTVKTMVHTAEGAATLRQLISCCVRKIEEGDQEDITKVIITHGPGKHRNSLFIFWFHRAVSDSTIDGRTQFSYASAIVVLRFAYAFLKDPSVLTTQDPPDKVVNQAIGAMRMGNACYDSFHEGQALELGPDDTLRACKALGFKMVFKEDVYSQHLEKMAMPIFYLQPGEVLLLYRYKPYKVASVVCTANPDSVCLFDSQLHQVNYQLGGMVFCSPRQQSLMMLTQYQNYVLTFQGKCSIVLLTQDDVI